MRPIDADELIEHLKKDPLYKLIEPYGIEAVIESRPTVDLTTHGEWIPIINDNDIFWECSNCQCESEAWTDYCPICGSRNIKEASGEFDVAAFISMIEEMEK